MLDNIKTHFWHYLILIFVLAIGGIVIFNLPDKALKFQAAVLLATAYILWGIFHHLLENNLNLKIVIEYSLIGILSVLVLGGILL